MTTGSMVRVVSLVGFALAGMAALWGAEQGSPAAADGLPLWTMFMGLLGGVALFLAGMDQMAGGLKAIAGDGLRTFLARLTRNRVSGVFTGATVTAVIQSSSVT